MLGLEVLERDKSWDSYFMHLAEESATRSKDPSTKVGACIVKDKRVLSLGYNGAPRKFPDELVPFTNSNDLMSSKNAYMCHAELNAILNYRGSLSELENSSIYCTLTPCHECMKALIQIGVKKIVYKNTYHNSSTVELSRYMADKCGIEMRGLENDC